MFRVLSFLFVIAFALPVQAHSPSANSLEAAFDPDRFSAAETRMLQIALAATSDYHGPVSGIWTIESQHAIEAYTDREFGEAVLDLHAAALIITLFADMNARGWELRHFPELGISLAIPEAVFTAPEPENNGQRWWSRDGSLTLLTSRIDPGLTLAWHEAAAASNTDPAALETLRDPSLLITAGTHADGRSYYTRSDRIGDDWTTIYIASGADEADLANLIRVSIEAGEPDPWEVPEGGMLDGLVREAISLIEEEEPGPGFGFLPPTESARLPDPGSAATGTGFYVGPKMLVTAAHVIEGCTWITLEDGTRASLVAHDVDLDVALLSTKQTSGAWLDLSGISRARLGQSVHAAGYPYYNIAGTSLHLTGGNVSSLADLNDDPRFFSFSAPVQPGNSGGPLIGHDGRVVGLVVSRLSERYIAEATGTLPQNVNYALGSAGLHRFLNAYGALPSQPGIGTFTLDTGAPDNFLAAVVPVLCE